MVSLSKTMSKEVKDHLMHPLFDPLTRFLDILNDRYKTNERPKAAYCTDIRRMKREVQQELIKGANVKLTSINPLSVHNIYMYTSI